MATNIIDITKYSPKGSDVFFFDNNIWMYLFCPLGNYNIKRQRNYSSFLQSIETSHSAIFINSLILSEFTNRYLRMDFELWKNEEGFHDANFKKHYIGNDRYQDTVTEIKRQVKQIIALCEKSSDNFNAVDLDNILKHLTYIDFNDSYYLELANISGWKIVTDDSDFSTYEDHDIEIITYLN